MFTQPILGNSVWQEAITEAFTSAFEDSLLHVLCVQTVVVLCFGGRRDRSDWHWIFNGFKTHGSLDHDIYIDGYSTELHPYM